jgi:hypothetical protein
MNKRVKGFRIIRFFIYFFLLNAIAFTGIFIADMDTLQRYIHFDYMRMASAIIRSIISLTHLRIAFFLFKSFKDIPTWLKIVLAVLSRRDRFSWIPPQCILSFEFLLMQNKQKGLFLPSSFMTCRESPFDCCSYFSFDTSNFSLPMK